MAEPQEQEQKLPQGAQYGTPTATSAAPAATLPAGAQYGKPAPAASAPQTTVAMDQAAQPWQNFTGGETTIPGIVGHQLDPRNLAANAGSGFLSGLKGVGTAILHPVDTVRNDAAARAQQGEQARSNYDPQHPVMSTISSLGHSTAEALPLIGPWAASLGEQAGQGDVGGAVANGVGGYLGAKAGLKAVGIVNPVRVTAAEPMPVDIPGLRGATVPSGLPSVEFRTPPAYTFLKGAAADIPIVKGGIKAVKSVETDAANTRAAKAEADNKAMVQEQSDLARDPGPVAQNFNYDGGGGLRVLPTGEGEITTKTGQKMTIPADLVSKVKPGVVSVTQLTPEEYDAKIARIQARMKTPEQLGLTPKSGGMTSEPSGLTTKPSEVQVEEVGGGKTGDMLRTNEKAPTSEEVDSTAKDFMRQVKPQLEKGLGVEKETVSTHPETAELQNAGAKHADATRITTTLKHLDGVNGFPEWAMDNGYDMGDKLIGRGKADAAAGTHVSRAQVLREMLKTMSPEELEDSVNEFLMKKKK